MLMSMIAAPRCSLSFAASAITCGLAAGELERHRLLDRVPQRLLQRLAGFADHRLAGDHLADRQPGAVALDDSPERQIGDARHRRQDHRRVDADRTDRGWASRRLMGRRAFTGAALGGARRGAARMTVTALIVAAGSGAAPRRRRAQAISPARRQAGAALGVEALAGHPRDRRGARRDRRRPGRAGERRAWRAATSAPLIAGGASAAGQRPRRPGGDRRRRGAGPRRRPPLLPARRHRPAARRARGPRRRRAGAAGRRHAGTRRRTSSASRSTAPAWSASRPRRPSTLEALHRRLCAMARAQPRPTNRRSLRAAGLKRRAGRRRSDARQADHGRRLRRAPRRCSPRGSIAAHRHGLRRPRLRRRRAGDARRHRRSRTTAASPATATPTSCSTPSPTPCSAPPALGDIGEHFPPSDPHWKGAASDLFLAHAAELIRAAAASSTMSTARSSARSRRSARIAPPCAPADRRILGLAEKPVSIKATTTERLGFTGRGEGIAAQAVANIRMELSR